MDKKELITRRKTPAGLEISLFNESAEVELGRMPFGLNIELINAQSSIDQSAPLGAYYRITFYKIDKSPGKRDSDNTPLPGAIYLTPGGVIILGAKSLPGTNNSVIDYRDSF